MWFVPLLFFVISFLFSMLGMGGSQLYIPILFWVGMDLKTEAIPLGILLNVISSASSAIVYSMRRMVSWRIALPLALAMLVLAPVGAQLNTRVSELVLLIVFALFTLSAALLMLSGWRSAWRWRSPIARVGTGVVGGGVLGFVAGFIGRGGGSFVVPLLCMSGMEAKAAAATSTFVVFCTGIASLVAHIAGAAQPQWGLWIACAACVLAGSQLGSRVMADRLRPKGVRKLFGIVLVAVALLILVKDVLLA